MSTFANQREPAPVQGTAAALPNNGGTAAGSVGVAVPLALLTAGGRCMRWSHGQPGFLTPAVFAFATLTRACQIGAAISK